MIKTILTLPVIAWLVVSLAKAQETPKDVITLPNPSAPIPVGETVFWSPLFQATWDAMNEHMGGKPQKIDPQNEVMARLDAFEWKVDEVMPAGAWKTWAGEATPDFLKRVNAEAREMIGEDPFRLSSEQIPSTIACFGLLDQEVEFEKEFRQSIKKPMEFKVGDKVKRVAFFGTRGELSANYGEEVRILHSAGNGHALEVSCKGGDDKVILYLPPEPQNFDEACAIIREARKAGVSLLHAGDDVRIPYLSLDVTSDLSDQLKGGRFYGKPGDPWRIFRAEQNTKFELLEKGAKVRVDVSLEMAPFGESPPPPRHFIYDRPFFVFLWREKAEWPYLGVWVGDDSVLRKF